MYKEKNIMKLLLLDIIPILRLQISRASERNIRFCYSLSIRFKYFCTLRKHVLSCIEYIYPRFYRHIFISNVYAVTNIYLHLV